MEQIEKVVGKRENWIEEIITWFEKLRRLTICKSRMTGCYKPDSQFNVWTYLFIPMHSYSGHIIMQICIPSFALIFQSILTNFLGLIAVIIKRTFFMKIFSCISFLLCKQKAFDRLILVNRIYIEQLNVRPKNMV